MRGDVVLTVTLADVFNDVQTGQLYPIYFVQGQDQYLINLVREKFLTIIHPDDRALNLAQFDLTEVPLSLAIDDAKSVPFFGNQRVVILDNPYFLTGERQKSNLEHHVEDLVDYIKQPEPQTTVVIFAPYDKLDNRKKVTKLLKEQARYLSFVNLSDKDINRFIDQRVNEAGYFINSAAKQELIRLTNSSLTQIMSELDKLMLYTLSEKQINVSDVKELVTHTLSENIFDLIDCLLKGQLTRAVNLYHELLSTGEEPLRLHGALIGQFRLLLQVKSSEKSEKGIASELKVHPYRVKLAKRVVRKFSYVRLASAYLGLVSMEEQLKSTSRDPELLFELFILKYKNQMAE
ncbi:DNA polymerase III subunit delta [Weissella paramesenteroides]|jgi:DNA polymerase-3 subunit delta|uniref:DNA polymerase III subunit delta n=1 Tax=Weissella paramesenteroides TaxID=1249 RepID=UPI00103D8C3E|nr:DNA polymerase III subunit delta [Weissella paramesenteroides]KAA8439992.1 DNA polymerase III subunit delta [Weissella paramesenteroides]KAA8440555.1 DNA polymerase III subunit delta [Weissella paramesenteroides]KAA8443510.1 DNA polymerase III subunit delta [Weissella paramesenteroides]KAA8445363.1 DNA polymerase III subunit delta [Weissella paramesenteroides]KAA8448369.1 DNA polymerase III subunit delta [Weissella paramesenteroides]